MAGLISRASGNLTSASTWGTIINEQLWPNSNDISSTTSYVFGSLFTPGASNEIDGFALFGKRGTGTGTVTVGLSLDSGTTVVREVTVNATDFPVYASWVFFKFSSTVTGVNTNTGRIGLKASDAGNVVMSGAGGSSPWAQFVSSTTTKVPASGDKLFIVGEWTGPGTGSTFTVTMDNTDPSLDIGTASPVDIPSSTDSKNFNGIWIGQNGVLTWGTSSATNYRLKVSGQFLVFGSGTHNMGTAANPCPRDSTMTLLFDSGPASGTLVTYGFAAWSGSIVNIYGQSRTAGKDVVQCKLSADAAANATSLTVNADTGWLDNDEIVVAATGTDRTQCELGALNGGAGASTLTVDGFAGTAGGLAFSHSGTYPTQAEIINLTRNVVITGVSFTNPAYFRTYGTLSTSTLNVYWCRFSWVGAIPTFGNGNNIFSNNSAVEYCSFFESNQSTSFRGNVFNNNVFFSPSSSSTLLSADAGTSFSPTVTNNTIMRGGGGISVSSRGSYDNNTVVGASGTGFSITTTYISSITIANLVAHSCGSTGLNIGIIFGTADQSLVLSLNNAISWRNTGVGVTVGGSRAVLNNCIVFGCLGGGFSLTSNSFQYVLNNCIASSDSTATMPFAMRCGSLVTITCNNCKFSEVSGIYTANTSDIQVSQTAGTLTRPMVTLNNTLLGSATEVSNQAELYTSGFIKSSKHDQTEGAFKSWFQNGVIQNDTTIFNTAAPSERLTPTSATIKLASGSRVVAVDDGGTITINAYVRKSATGDGAEYNGNQPRLIVRANPACGINTDTVLDTMTAGTGAWEQLTGTTAAVDSDGALEFYVDCDGTTGWINVDDWSVT